MKNKFLNPSAYLAVIPALVAMSVGSAHAETINVATPNLFSGETALTSAGVTSYPSIGLTGDISAINDLDPKTGVLLDESSPKSLISYVSFSGQTTTSIVDEINIFDNPSDLGGTDGGREASNVAIYYTTATGLTNAQLLDPSNYTSVLNQALTYSGLTTGADNTDFAGAQIRYQSFTGLDIPVGTTSILLGFTKNQGANGEIYGPDYPNYTHGVGFTDIQAFSQTVVPEPSTYALMLGGLAVLFYGLRRKSKV